MKTLAAVLLALAGFFALGASGWLTPVTAPLTGALATAGAPLYRLASAMERARHAVETGTLEPDAVERLVAENAKLRTLVAENAALKEALDYQERFADRTVLARVIAPTADAASHGIVIDRGSADGIRTGRPVLTAGGALVGKVATVRERTAQVLLLTDSQSRVAVAIQNGSGTVGVLEGDRGLALTISLIPLSESLAPGETVVTSGLEPGIRRGIPVGTVQAVSRSAQDPFQTASVAPFRSSLNPAFVQVLLEPGQD